VSTRFLIPNEQSDQLSEFCGIDPLRLGLNGRRLLFVEQSHVCFRALSCPAIETGTSGGLDVPNDRQDVGRKLRRLRLAGHSHALDWIERTQLLSACFGAARAAFERLRYSFISAKVALRSHNAKAARSSNAGAEGVVGRHL
jgi:hypothetical protein